MKAAVALLLFALMAVASPGHAAAADCALPHGKTVWVDFGDTGVPFWRVFAKPGNIVAAANFVQPARIRALGAKTVYFDLSFRFRIGTPTAPESAAVVAEKAQKLYDYAAAAMGCDTPAIALNELFGASTPTPWSPSNARYRENVMIFVRTLAARGARPFLLINSKPYTGGEAADWWREASQYADLVREVYFPAPRIYTQGAAQGSRSLRTLFRRDVTELLEIGVPPDRLGIMLGFQTTPGFGGRERLRPARAWFEVVKWQALAARQVARELALASVWSWGWGEWNRTERDRDKPTAACVWLWARDPRLCNGPKAAGALFDVSRRAGQIDFPPSIQCTLDGRVLSSSSLARLTKVTGDRDVAYTALYRRLAESAVAHVARDRVLAAERSIVDTRFGRSFAAYRAALARSNAGQAIARGIIGDGLREAAIRSRLKVPYPSGADVADYRQTYADTMSRYVQVTPAPWWLNGRKRGVALATTAPGRIFTLPTGSRASVWTRTTRYRVKVLGPARPLSEAGGAARPAIVAAVRDVLRGQRYETWSLRRQAQARRGLACARDELPDEAPVDLTEYLPFLATSG